MQPSLIATKLYLPALRRTFVSRIRLIERLHRDRERKLTLICAPAGFGKTTLASEWAAGCGWPVAWVSLEESERDPRRFWLCVIQALQTLDGAIGEEIKAALQGPSSPPVDLLLPSLLNEIAKRSEPWLLILDDYHTVGKSEVDRQLAFWLKHQPQHLHLGLVTREEPQIPLARLRSQGQVFDLRAADLRFTPSEVSSFLQKVMGMTLSERGVAILERQMEGWIAGIQFAALWLQGAKSPEDLEGGLEVFQGNPGWVADYLLEEVLQQQSPQIQRFLLETACLDRLCGPLCDAVLQDPEIRSQALLEEIERLNLFLNPLDGQRRWYRYHPLFATLLRQRGKDEERSIEGQTRPWTERHLRASRWYEKEGLALEAFHHAILSGDIDRAAEVAEGQGMPLHFRGGIHPVLQWLSSLPLGAFASRPSLAVIHASALLYVGSFAEVEPKLRMAEEVLSKAEAGPAILDLRGHIAAIRATAAVREYDAQAILEESERALELLHPENVAVRTSMLWTRGHAYYLQGDKVAAAQAYTEAIQRSLAIGHVIILITAKIGLARIYEEEGQLRLADAMYREIVEVAGQPEPPILCEAYLGLARIALAQGDLATSHKAAETSLRLARQLYGSDRSLVCQLFLARWRLAAGDTEGAASLISEVADLAKLHGFRQPLSEIAQVQDLIDKKRVEADSFPSAGEEGDAATSGRSPATYAQGHAAPTSETSGRAAEPIESLSAREIEVLRLIEQGFSNDEIGKQLFVTESTIKGHNQRIFGKLAVRRRTEAVARARKLGLL